jgi:ABC-type sulfate/molybdate transport systems ATPase subunit
VIGCRDLRVHAGARQLLHVPALDVADGSTLAVLGANGAGKSTLLRALGVLSPHRITGDILIDNAPATPEVVRRATAAVLQRPILQRGTVAANAASGLRFRGISRRDAAARAAPWLTALGVAHLTDRDVRSLSGGEAQRVSLARALAVEPRVLLLDEPFTSLDATTRADLLADLLATLHGRDTATVLVTHDRHEAAALADHLLVLADGRVRSHGPLARLVEQPPDVDTARLLGWTNVVSCATHTYVARPEHSRITPHNEPGLCVPGTLRRVVPLGPSTRVDIDTANGPLTCLYPTDAAALHPPAAGSDVTVGLAHPRSVRPEPDAS